MSARTVNCLPEYIMSLTQFHPAFRDWFTAQFGEPTQAQAWACDQSWPSAPTGSGKALAAFYAVFDDLVVRGLKRQLNPGVQILYVSLLIALPADVHC